MNTQTDEYSDKNYMATQLSELSNIYRTIDETLGEVESTLHGTVSPEKFEEEVEFEVLVNLGDYHISRSRSKKAGASWKMHMHPDSIEVVIMVRGRGVAIYGNNRVEMSATDTLTIPKQVMHGGYSLEDDTEIISIIMPTDVNVEKFLNLLKSGRYGGI